MQIVDIYIGTSLRGPAKGAGRVMYIMHTKLKSGKEHEVAPEIGEYDDATESRLILYAIRDALSRMNYACRVVIHTECDYVAAAINQHWPEEWVQNSWKNSKKKDVKDATLWSMILQELEDTGHQLEAVKEKHEWSEWMRYKMPLVPAYKNVFSKVEK